MPKPTGELKSKWAIHVRTWMESHPGVSYKDAQKQAKDSYQATKAVKPAKVTKVKVAKVVKERVPSVWIDHIKTYQAEHPEIKYGEAMRKAKVTYATAKVAPVVNSVVEEKQQSGAGMADEVMGSGKIKKPDLDRLHEEIGRIELDYSSVAKRHKENERDSKIREVMKEHGESEDGTDAAPEEIAHYESKVKSETPIEKVDVPIAVVRPVMERKYAKCACGRRVCSCARLDNCC